MAATAFQLDVESILANPNSQMIVSIPGIVSVVCFIQEGFGFAAGNAYSNAFESQALAKSSEIYNKAAPAAGAILEKVGVNIPAQIGPQTFFNTTESWAGPQKPSFSVKTTFVAVKPTDDVTKQVRQIMRACFPTGDLTGIMKSPLDYGPNLQVNGVKNISLSIQGTVNLKIGTWFQAMGLILESAHPKFSAQVIKNGKPLYCEMEMSFKPYRAITYDEFLGYFIS